MAKTVYIIAGPNGAGKTTFAREFLPHYADCRNFINADLIAQGIAPLAPEKAAMRAGRMMLAEIQRAARKGLDFGFETTLSGKTHGALIDRLKNSGYRVHLYYLWVADEDLLLSRIQGRVMEGGHDVPAEVVRRRFARSVQNFFQTYSEMAKAWFLFENSGRAPNLVAAQEFGHLRILKVDLYSRWRAEFGGRI